MSTHTLPEREETNALALIGRVWAGVADQGSAGSVVTVGNAAPIGVGIRLGLSIGALCICLAIVFMFVGTIEASSGRVADEFIAMSVATAGMGWCVLLYRIWANFRNWRRALRAALVCVITWTLAAGMMALIDAISHRAEFLISAVALLATGLTIANITHAIWAHKRAKSLALPAVPLRINCPTCGYSMSGLDNCTCPECGKRYTLDLLIRSQTTIPAELQQTKREIKADESQNALPPSESLASN